MYDPLFVLAGGFGTRLKSVEKKLPKALIDVCGKTFLSQIFLIWYNAGIRNFVFLLHYKSDQIIHELNELKGCYNNCKIKYIVEDVPLGTGGSVINAINTLKTSDRIFVTNADTWLDYIPAPIIYNKKNAILRMLVDTNERYGEIEFEGSIVKKFVEKESISKKSNSSFNINVGFYSFIVKDLKNIINRNNNFSMEYNILPWLAERDILHCHEYQGNFWDIGVPKDYFNFVKFLESN